MQTAQCKWRVRRLGLRLGLGFVIALRWAIRIAPFALRRIQKAPRFFASLCTLIDIGAMSMIDIAPMSIKVQRDAKKRRAFRLWKPLHILVFQTSLTSRPCTAVYLSSNDANKVARHKLTWLRLDDQFILNCCQRCSDQLLSLNWNCQAAKNIFFVLNSVCQLANA